MENLLKDYQIAHIGFVVENREKAMARLNELYDIQEWQMVEWRPSKYVYRGQEYKDTYVKIAISLPNTGTRIEVLEPQTPGLQMDVLKGGTQTINHICHVVRDGYGQSDQLPVVCTGDHSCIRVSVLAKAILDASGARRAAAHQS